MGLFDSAKENHENAYAKGVEDAENESCITGLAHIICDCLPVPQSEYHESYEAGYHGKK